MFKRYKIANKEFDLLVKIGIWRPSNSSATSPLHLVSNKDPDDWRPCGDFKGLICIPVPDRYPLSHIQDFNMDTAESFNR